MSLQFLMQMERIFQLYLMKILIQHFLFMLPTVSSFFFSLFSLLFPLISSCKQHQSTLPLWLYLQAWWCSGQYSDPCILLLACIRSINLYFYFLENLLVFPSLLLFTYLAFVSVSVSNKINNNKNNNNNNNKKKKSKRIYCCH